MIDEPPQPPRNISNKTISSKWNRMCSQFSFQTAVKEHPLGFVIFFLTFSAMAVGIGVGFGLDWQRSASSSQGECICEEGNVIIW